MNNITGMPSEVKLISLKEATNGEEMGELVLRHHAPGEHQNQLGKVLLGERENEVSEDALSLVDGLEVHSCVEILEQKED